MRCLLDAITDVEMKILCVCVIFAMRKSLCLALRDSIAHAVPDSRAPRSYYMHIYVARIISKTHTDGDAHTQHPCGAATEMICIYM